MVYKGHLSVRVRGVYPQCVCGFPGITHMAASRAVQERCREWTCAGGGSLCPCFGEERMSFGPGMRVHICLEEGVHALVVCICIIGCVYVCVQREKTGLPPGKCTGHWTFSDLLIVLTEKGHSGASCF